MTRRRRAGGKTLAPREAVRPLLRRALKYLAAYIFRVALSNRRLVKLEQGRVTFRYTDSHTHQTRLCTLPVEAFLQRFLQHVLPRGCVKVRYYGLFSPRRRPQLAALRLWLSAPATAPAAALVTLTEPELAASPRPTSGTPLRYPTCGTVMVGQPLLRPTARCPP